MVAESSPRPPLEQPISTVSGDVPTQQQPGLPPWLSVVVPLGQVTLGLLPSAHWAYLQMRSPGPESWRVGSTLHPKVSSPAYLYQSTSLPPWPSMPATFVPLESQSSMPL